MNCLEKEKNIRFCGEFHTSVPVKCHMMILGDRKAEVAIEF
jgi:hypothetical protein